jgi:hypothetical protein
MPKVNVNFWVEYYLILASFQAFLFWFFMSLFVSLFAFISKVFCLYLSVYIACLSISDNNVFQLSHLSFCQNHKLWHFFNLSVNFTLPIFLFHIYICPFL